MLADSINIVPQSGHFDPEIHHPFTVKMELVSFIADELPLWREHPDLPTAEAEPKLNEYLCDHLNGAVYKSSTWDHIQFRSETADEICGGRRTDISVKPLAATFIIEGRRHSQFQALFPIECKRLPTPVGKNRDPREYVTSEPRTTGGIQRFKFGYHGAAHTFAAMIAYVQEQTFSHWIHQINRWILELAVEQPTIWCDTDILYQLSDNLITGVSILKSELERTDDKGKCELMHLWVKMS